MHKHNVRYQKTIDDRISAVREAIALTDDEGVIAPNQFMAEQLAIQLKTMLGSIEAIEKEIAVRYRSLADREIFDSFPAAGAQFAPRLLVAVNGGVKQRISGEPFLGFENTGQAIVQNRISSKRSV